jgi:hypothetical protein
MEMKGLKDAVRISSAVPEKTTMHIKGFIKEVKYTFCSIPFYLICELQRLVDA